MAGTRITGSSNISLLDSRIFASVCDGKFIIDGTTSVFLGSGADNVLGIKVQITNPYGVIIRPYGAGYDIAPPITGTFEYDMPTQAGKIQYGIYKIELQLTDADSTTYVVSKNVNVCTYTSDNNPCDERVRMLSDCKNGTVTFQLSEPPTFKGKFAESTYQSVRIDYPTASGLPSFTTTVGNFSMALFQGVYKATVSVCASYDMGDNIWLQLPYDVVKEKNVKCLLDYSCIFPAIDRLNKKFEDCLSEKDKIYYSSVSLQALVYLKSAELANDAGADAAEYIDKLEKLLGCTCTCDCSGSPIVNSTPSTSLSIEGCLFTKETVGLTDVYTFAGKNYFLTVDDSNNVLGISGVSDYGCNAYQQLTFNAEAAYELIKAQIDNTNEEAFWAGVVNNTLANLNAACFGYNPTTWAALTLAQKIQVIMNAACNGGYCITSVSGVATSRIGADVLIEFTQTGGFSADVYVDGIFRGNVLASTGELLLLNAADGETHSYNIIPKCSNGSNGTAATGTFGFIGCPTIAPPIVTDNTVNGVNCPYDLTNLIYPAPPMGIEVEWHTANNTSNISLVADPENVTGGVYYAFAKDANDCYSAATVVTLICDGATSCSAPQSLLVVDAVGGYKVSFLSANNPPPLNSYTVKRKAFADPDVDGSYTTIGTPTYNSSTNRWEITDTTGVDNTLYTYKAISNCSSSSPAVLYTFANLTCPVVTMTPADTEADYSFTNVGGEVDKYEVSLYDSTGAVLISTQTITPSFSTPITGTFTYLTEGTSYVVKVKVFIGTYSTTCASEPFVTTGGDAIAGFVSNSVVASVTSLTFNGNAAVYVSGTDFPIGTMQTGNFETEEVGATLTVVANITGTFTSVNFQDVYGNNHILPFVGAGNYTFTNVPILPGYGGWFMQVN